MTLFGKLVVEVDGATHASSIELALDDIRTRHLEALRFRLVCVTNIDVYDNLDGVLEMILSELKLP